MIAMIADPDMFLLGVATLLHRCHIAMIYLSFVWMKTLIFPRLRFSCSGCPHLRLSWTQKQKRSTRRSVRWNKIIYLLIALPVVLNCEFAVQLDFIQCPFPNQIQFGLEKIHPKNASDFPNQFQFGLERKNGILQDADSKPNSDWFGKN